MVIKPAATLEHFEDLFSRSADPWQTRSSQAERYKRNTVLTLLGSACHGRVLELGCGNGSNSIGLARRALSLDACDGAREALRHAASLVGDMPDVTFHLTPLPSLFPADRYDAIVIAELLYYLDSRCLAAVMREIDRTLRPGGVLILCHHHIQFADAIQRQLGLHERFTESSHYGWINGRTRRTARWIAQSLRRPKARRKDS